MNANLKEDSRRYCSVEASQENAALVGTAVEVQYWLLVEYNRAWKPKALLDNDLGDLINTHLDELPREFAALSGLKLRVQFVKQASSRIRKYPKILIARGIDHPSLFERQLVQPDDLLHLSCEQILDPVTAGFTPLQDSIVLVCTNGQRDVCCARFGLPVYASLDADLGDRAWQTTHVGGHRYAPNILHLPSGLLHGFVSAEEAPEVVRALDQGKLTLDRLRGRSALPPASQAAEVFVNRDREQRANTYLTWLDQVELDQHTHKVRFLDPHQQMVTVELRTSLSEPVLASCEGKAKPVKEFELIAIE
ncbi:MAG: sucrase ferredoxin [Pseudomonadota bacterium]